MAQFRGTPSDTGTAGPSAGPERAGSGRGASRAERTAGSAGSAPRCSLLARRGGPAASAAPHPTTAASANPPQEPAAAGPASGSERAAAEQAGLLPVLLPLLRRGAQLNMMEAGSWFAVWAI